MVKKHKKLLSFSVLALAVILVVVIFVQNSNQTNFRRASMGDTQINLELALSSEEQAKGLSGRVGLPQDEGLLFIYDEPENVGIWMKDMKFAIDVLWLNEGKEIIHVVENMNPGSYKSDREAEIYRPQGLAKYVLEVNAGVVEQSQIQIGDKIKLL